MTNKVLFSPLSLPNGTSLPNRLCKAAMEENLSTPDHLPGDDLFTLYKTWAKGGVGLMLSGNVMVAPDALSGPGAVVLEASSDLEPFKKWARAGTPADGQFWMQINHPGRQIQVAMGEQAVAPSAIAVDIGRHSKIMAQPRALESNEIKEIIKRFVTTASLAEQAGFSGVQLHAAHGYLISQFLSPLTNKRTDEWGGSLENRARFLFDTLKGIRAVVSPGFSVSVKLNSADFQKGGFDVQDAKWVTQQLNGLGVDLLELSGGSYESPAMHGQGDESSTSKREAYFVDFARDIATVADMPIMVTGGIYKKDTAIAALEKDAAGFGVDVLGIAKALAYVPNLPDLWIAGKHSEVSLPRAEWKDPMLAGAATTSIARRQLVRMSNGKAPDANASPLVSFVLDRLRTRKLLKRYHSWRKGQ